MITAEEKIKFLAESWGKGNIYYVGGYVRDLLMGLEPKDYDLVIDYPKGSQEFIEFLKSRFSDICSGFVIYERYGTSKFSLRLSPEKIVDIECVIPRTETYKDGPRKPDSITQTTISEDAKRRDFCCNALYKNVITGEILDPTGFGLDDLKNRILRTPLDPEQTYIDDPLRMLRAFRFSYQKGFTIEENTRKAIKPYPEYYSLSMERVRDEFTKILISDKSWEAIRELQEVGLLSYIIPELSESWGYNQNSRYHSLNLTDHTLSVLEKCCSSKLEVRLAALLHDIGKYKNHQENSDGTFSYKGHEVLSASMSEDILKRLKYSGDIISYVKKLIENHMLLKPLYNYKTKMYTGKPKKTREIISKFSYEFLQDLMSLIKGDNLSHSLKYNMPGQVESFWDHYALLSKEITHSEKFFISGDEIMKEFNITEPSKLVGQIKTLLQDWYNSDPKITKEELFEKYRHWYFSEKFWIAKNKVTKEYILSINEPIPDKDGYINDSKAIVFDDFSNYPELKEEDKKELEAWRYPLLWDMLEDRENSNFILTQIGELLHQYVGMKNFEKVRIDFDSYNDFSAIVTWKNRKEDFIF